MSKASIVFNRTIEASSGTLVDFDRASLLMDKELFQRAFDAIRNDRDNCPPWDMSFCGAQRVWDSYCQRHLGRYRKPFAPDVTPGWGEPPPDPPEPPPRPISDEEAEEMTKAIRVLTPERWHEIRAKLIERWTYDPARPPCEYWPDDRCRYSPPDVRDNNG
jgi:hypothetical protein